jgi:hypothetical protein
MTSILGVAGRTGVQDHLTLAFPLKAAADAKALAEKLPPLMPDLAKGADAVGTVHYSRFVVLSEKTLIFLADFDGKLDKFLGDLAKNAGPVFDAVLEHVDGPPPSPVANNIEAFVTWAMQHTLSPISVYTAYPTGTVQDIKSRAAAAGITSEAQQLPFLVILPLKSSVAAIALEGVFKVAGSKLVDAADTVGTLHLAQFVLLEDHKLGFFTVYDGPFDKYIQDFAEKLGPVFDLLFKFVKDAPPTPSAKNADALTKWVAEHNLPPIGMYNAYPGLRVQDVNALLADAGETSSAQSA